MIPKIQSPIPPTNLKSEIIARVKRGCRANEATRIGHGGTHDIGNAEGGHSKLRHRRTDVLPIGEIDSCGISSARCHGSRVLICGITGVQISLSESG
jgi:hypothetical protein